jgi:Sedlin, N-terminal conserved region
MLLHETRNDEGIRAFFSDVWECYVKTLLNPFYAVDKSIKSPTFESRVRAIAKVISLFKGLLIPSDIYSNLNSSKKASKFASAHLAILLSGCTKLSLE